MVTKQQLTAAGLSSEECPLPHCYGHLNQTPKGFKCTLCKAEFLTGTATQWKRIRGVMKSIMDQWQEESRIEAELTGFWGLEDIEE